MAYINIDLSLRSTGLTAIDEDRRLIDYDVVQSVNDISKQAKKYKQLPEYNGSQLLIYNAQKIVSFIERVNNSYAIDGIVIEGISFGSSSGKGDIISGNWWYVRTEIRKKFPNVPIGSVPVLSWRSKVLNKADKIEAKEKWGRKFLKEGVVAKLPTEVYEEFCSYISKNKLKYNSIYDLADSYYMGCYRVSLE